MSPESRSELVGRLNPNSSNLATSSSRLFWPKFVRFNKSSSVYSSICPTVVIFSLPKQFLGLSERSRASTDSDKSGELPSEIVNSPNSSPTPSSISANNFHNSPKVFPTEDIDSVGFIEPSVSTSRVNLS